MPVLLALLAAPAVAADEPGFVPAAPLTSPSSNPLTGTPLQPVVNLGQSLLNAGILPRFRSIDAFAANPIGGVSTGTDASGVIIFGTDLDLDRLSDLPGLVAHLSFAQLYGHELSTDHIGSRTKVQSYYYPYKQFEVSELTLEQSWFNDRLNALAGRANATGEFARDTYGCRFEGVADCPFELTQLVAGFPGFPYVNWGGRVRVRPTEAVSLKVGAYELNSIRNMNSGFDLGTAHSSGFVLPAELAYETTYANDPFPRHYKAGLWYNSADYADPYLNASGRSRATFGGAALNHSGGRTGAYALADQVVWHGPPTTEQAALQRGIAVFSAAGKPFDGNELFAFQAVAGAVWNGPFERRQADSINLETSYIRLSHKEAGYLNGRLLKARSTSFIPQDSFVVELNYAAQVVPGVTLVPALQYLIGPDDIGRPNSTFAPRDALVVGVKLVIDGGQLLGLPDQLPSFNRAGAP